MYKSNLYNIIDIDKNDIRIDGTIPPISAENVHEFKIGKNFFYRIIENEKLIFVQNRLNSFFLNKIPLNGAAVAFRNGYSYLNLFEPHKKNYYFLRLDVRTFFHSIRIEDVKAAVGKYFSDNGDGKDCINDFLNIVSYTVPEDSPNTKFRNKTIIPMGFATSPAISNIVFRKVDIQIQKFCSEKNIVYTRYADDMLFSSSRENAFTHSNSFVNEIRILISQLNLKLNAKKTIKSKHTLSINGYVIQSEISNPKFSYLFAAIKHKSQHNIADFEIRISNKKTKIIKKIIHMCSKNIPPQIVLNKLFGYKIDTKNFDSAPTPETMKKYYMDQLKNKVSGYRSYLISIVLFDNKYKCTSTHRINEYTKLIDELNSIISSN